MSPGKSVMKKYAKEELTITKQHHAMDSLSELGYHEKMKTNNNNYVYRYLGHDD